MVSVFRVDQKEKRFCLYNFLRTKWLLVRNKDLQHQLKPAILFSTIRQMVSITLSFELTTKVSSLDIEGKQTSYNFSPWPKTQLSDILQSISPLWKKKAFPRLGSPKSSSCSSQLPGYSHSPAFIHEDSSASLPFLLPSFDSISLKAGMNQFSNHPIPWGHFLVFLFSFLNW